MNRIIKFRYWNGYAKTMYPPESFGLSLAGKFLVKLADEQGSFVETNWHKKDALMQFTGLTDKNGLKEVYEGDIIDSNGNIKGNVYEMDKGETDLVIEGLGTSAWSKTEMAGLGRGLKYSE